MKITEEAIEALALELHNEFCRDDYHAGAGWVGTACWDYKDEAREMLTKVAPIIAARALRDAADELEYGNPIREFLEERAHEINVA